MSKRVSVAVGLLAASGSVAAVLLTSGGGAATVAGCTTTLESQTGSNSGNLPAPIVQPPIVGVNIGNIPQYANNESAYVDQWKNCVSANPTGAL